MRDMITIAKIRRTIGLTDRTFYKICGGTTMKAYKQNCYNMCTMYSPRRAENIDFKIEDYLKELYLQTKGENPTFLQNPVSSNLALKINHEISERFHMKFQMDNHLLEESFIASGDDLQIARHLRYLPAFLHTHSFFEILCLVEGSCSHYINGQQQYLSKGDILIMAPGTMHAIHAADDDSLVINILIRSSTFNSAFLNTLTNKTILGDFFQKTLYHNKEHSYLLFHAGNDNSLFQILEYLYREECYDKRYKNAVKNQIAELFFSFLLRNHEKDVFIPNPTGANDDPDFVFLLKYMENNYQDISLKEMADFFHYSERHLIRLIQDYTGASFSKNIQQIRLNHAAALLEKTDLPVSGISSQIGYSNVSHFRKLFTERFSMSPQEYRKFHRER